jgi:hypothetical protein
MQAHFCSKLHKKISTLSNVVYRILILCLNSLSLFLQKENREEFHIFFIYFYGTYRLFCIVSSIQKLIIKGASADSQF